MKDEIKENNSVMKCCICNNENIGEFIVIEDKKYHLNCITNLQEEIEDLREDNYAYHQLMKMQNKREYRSKFLKEFQEEFGTNTFPDYDEIYKRYDKVKKENEKVHKELDYADNYNIYLISKIDKAIELLNRHNIDTGDIYYKYNGRFVKSELKERIREILGGDEE